MKGALRMKKIAVILLGTVMALAWTVRAEDLPAPEKKKVTVTDLQAQLIDYDGKVVEMEFTYIDSLDQVEQGLYNVFCGYYRSGYSLRSCVVYFGEDGKEFFSKLAKQSSGYLNTFTETVYVQINDKKLYAVGTRYRKGKGYQW
jgi:trehalose utilization protein